ncbi:MAG: alpha/beta hydrolase [Pseudomonadales bacterium]|nr:alpha/beta hydrolase [Pseudomonadales bacterium]
MYIAYAVVLLLIVGGIHALRQYLFNVSQAPKNHEPFAGKLFEAGEATIAYRPAAVKAHATVVAMPGFLEDHRYFTGLYSDPDVELVLINSCNYHPPVIPNNRESCGFFNNYGFDLGSIEYDAAVLNWAVENLVTTNKMRLHGHSRGGAVVLEALKQNPSLHRESEVVLEAPVLPQGKGYPALEAAFGTIGLYLLPLIVPLIKRIPAGLYLPILYRPMNERKKTLLPGLFYNPKNYRTIVENIHSLEQWMEQNDFSIYQNVKNGVILIAEKDTVLDRKSMLASAHKAGDGVSVIETKNTSHFVSLDDPAVVPLISKSNDIKGSPKSVVFSR